MPSRRLAAPLLLALAACAGSEATGGALDLQIIGLPPGVSAVVAVAGPFGWQATATASQPFPAPVGTYVVTASDVEAGGATWVATVSGSPATVPNGSYAQVLVTYQAAGALALEVTGLPAGTLADVEVSGPSGFHRVVTGSGLLERLRPGAYAVAARPMDSGGVVVPPRWRPVRGEALSVEVAPGGQARALVGYQRMPGTGRLWISSPVDDLGGTVGAIYGIATSELEGGPPSRIRLETAPGVGPLAVDAEGNLWVGNTQSGEIQMLPAASLEASGPAAPAIRIQPAVFASGDRLRALALEAGGNLWVASGPFGCLGQFLRADLATSGPKAPSRQACRGDGPQGIAFDPVGNLWTADSRTFAALMYSPPALLSGQPMDRILPSGLQEPTSLAFDEAGGLAIGGRGGDVGAPGLAWFSPQRLASAAVARQIGLPHRVDGLAFDHAGWLWYSGSQPGAFVQALAPSSLAGGPLERRPPIGAGRQPTGLAFSPPPPGLPLARLTLPAD